MKAKQLKEKLAKAEPDAVVWIEVDGIWTKLKKVELGVMSGSDRDRRHRHVVRLTAARTR